METLTKLQTLEPTETVSPDPGPSAVQSPGDPRKVPNRYGILVVATVASHLTFIAYMLFGGFLGLRWRRSLWLHVPAGVWGMITLTFSLRCPLTELEVWARPKAGWPPLPPKGFVGRYIRGVVVPDRWMRAAEITVGVTIPLSWALSAWRHSRRR